MPTWSHLPRPADTPITQEIPRGLEGLPRGWGQRSSMRAEEVPLFLSLGKSGEFPEPPCVGVGEAAWHTFPLLSLPASGAAVRLSTSPGAILSTVCRSEGVVSAFLEHLTQEARVGLLRVQVDQPRQRPEGLDFQKAEPLGPHWGCLPHGLVTGRCDSWIKDGL